MKSVLIALLFQLIAVLPSFAQKVVIQGKILDGETGNPIPFVNVILKDLRLGTASNSEGDFQFRLDSLPVRVVFSHISYQTKEISIEDERRLTIRLQPRKIVMHEVVVEENRTGDYLYSLVRKVYLHTLRTSNKSHYGKAFYRQVSKNEDDYSELYEIFYDTRFSTIGIEDWAIQEGRYALKTTPMANEYIYNKNFTLLSRVLSIVQPATEDIIQPVSEQVDQYYDLKMEHLIEMDGRKVGVISFAPKPGLTTPAMEGKLYVDIDRYDILKMQGRIRNDRLKFISISTKTGGWKQYTLSFDMVYKTEADSTLVLDYIRLDQSFDFYLNDVFMHPVETHAFMFFYEYYQPERKKRLGGRLVRFDRRDRDVLNDIGYNPVFWEQNPVVKRTPVEEDVIKSFEAAHAFGSIYLNNRQQLVLEDNELDKDAFVVSLKKALKINGYAFVGEKVFLHLDKPFYAAGETIRFSAFLVHAATHLLSSTSGVLYVELLDSNHEIVSRARVSLQEGRGSSQIDLSGDLAAGTYQILAYTNWMRNFDPEWFYSLKVNIFNSGLKQKQKISLRKKDLDIDLQFFPEGGELIGGIPALVAFKAIGPNGRHVDVKGNIYDSSGKKVNDFKSSHLGMGNLILAPGKDMSYYALISGDGKEHKYPLPEVKSEGYSMMVNNLKPKGVELLVKTSAEHHDAEFYLIARMRGVIYHRFKGRFQNRVIRLEIPKSKLPDGVLQITLFDDKKQPCCERLAFINNYQNPGFTLRTGNSGATRGEGSLLWLRLSDPDGKPVRDARVSVSVTSSKWVPYNRYQDNIYTHFLLNSDLKGCLENPGYYFVDDSRARQKALDLVMLTHGWRRFTWEDLLKDKKPVYKYHHQQFITVTGKALLKNSQKPASNIYLNFVPLSRSGVSGVISASTNAAGRFQLLISHVPDAGEFAVSAMNVKKKQIDVEVVIDTLIFPDEKGGNTCLLRDVDEKHILAYLEQERLNKPSEIKEEEKQAATDAEYKLLQTANPGNKNAKVVADFSKRPNNYGSVIQMLQSVVPGLLITGSGDNMQMSLRGSGMQGRNQPPLIILDGTVLVNPVMIRRSSARMIRLSQNQSQQNGSQNETNGQQNNNQGADARAALNETEDITNSSGQYSILSMVPVQDIGRVEVLKGPASSGVYGGQGSSGVILLYSKSLSGSGDYFDQDMYKNFDHVVLPGYHFSRTFYKPGYKSRNPEDIGGFSPTLYWLPMAVTDNRGRVRLNLNQIDIQRDPLRIEVEGITPYGTPVSDMLLLGGQVQQ